jgi:hypothetical protein
MINGNHVRFLANSRFGDWRKNEMGTIEKTLVTRQHNLNGIYIVEKEDGTRVWVTDQDIEVYEQLALF